MKETSPGLNSTATRPFPIQHLMPKGGRRQWYVAAYSFLLGLPLLLFPNSVIPFLGFAPTEELWVRITGMFLLGLTIMSLGIFRSPTAASLWGSILVRSWFTAVLFILALAGYAWDLHVLTTIVLIGVIGSMLAYRGEIRSLTSVLIAFLVGMLTADASNAAAPAEQQSNASFDTEVTIHYVDIGGLRLRYATAGQGDPLLLLHTMRTQLEYFRAVLPDLARNHQVIALDLPGHGESAIPDVEYTESFFTRSVAAFLKQLDLRNVTLVGESIGAAIALSLAADNPEGRVRRVVAVNPYDYADPDAGGITRSSIFAKTVFTAVEWPAMGWLMSLSERPFVLRQIMQGGFYDQTRLPDDLVTLFANTGAREGFHCAERSLFHHWHSWVDARRKYDAIRVPVSLIYGDHDWSLEQERIDNQKRIPGSQLVMLERTGHFASLESPDQVLRAILGQSCRACD
jgi:pimeloyl-ACP methyl ester carboxylesterase